MNLIIAIVLVVIGLCLIIGNRKLAELAHQNQVKFDQKLGEIRSHNISLVIPRLLSLIIGLVFIVFGLLFYFK